MKAQKIPVQIRYKIYPYIPFYRNQFALKGALVTMQEFILYVITSEIASNFISGNCVLSASGNKRQDFLSNST
jgi:hypothetical protein